MKTEEVIYPISGGLSTIVADGTEWKAVKSNREVTISGKI